MKRLWIGLSLAVVLLFPCSILLAGQAAPGVYADANHPAGPPDPEKIDQIWHVDPITDQVSITVPFTTEPQGGRGPKLPFSLLYNSGSTVTLQGTGSYYPGSGEQVNTFQWSTYPLDPSNTAPTGPWTTSGPYFYHSAPPNVADIVENPYNGVTITNVGCGMGGPYIYVDPSGASHDLNLQWFEWNDGISGPSVPQPDSPIPACAGAAGSYYGTGNSYWPNSGTFDGSSMITSASGITGPDGTTAGENGALVDANGNIATLSSPNSNGLITATDALGRTAFTTNIPIGQAGQIPAGIYTVTTYGPSGSPENYTVTFSTETLGNFPNYGNTGMAMPHPNPTSEITPATFCFLQSCTNQTSYSVAQPGPGPSPYTALPTGSFTAMTSISLPDGTSYQFSYDPVYGTVSKITFPTGGYVRFVWGVRDEDWTPYGQFKEISSIVVTDAYVSPNPGIENHWGYTPENSETPASLSTSSTPIGYMYAPDGSYTFYTGACGFDFDVIPYFNIGPKYSCKENSHTNYSSSGTVLASEVMTYTAEGLTQQDASTLYSGGGSPMQKQTVYYYDGYNNVLEKDESDYSACSPPEGEVTCPLPSQTAGPWLRKTFTSYEPGSAFSGSNIVDKPYQLLITDGSATPVPYSYTTYGYNQYANLTSENKCISGISATVSGHQITTGATCASSWQTQYAVDSTGQILSKMDGAGSLAAATTSYSWTGCAGDEDNGYLCSVTHPNGAVDSYTYFSYTGQVATHKDWNGQTTGQVTTYCYTSGGCNGTTSDPLNRITEILAPATNDAQTGTSASAFTLYTYSDTPGDFTVQEQHSIANGVTSSATTTYDGLGRKLTTNTASPQCSSGIQTETVYDSVGRVYQVYNPFCSTSDPTYGLTTYTYDGLNRKIQATLPDGSVGQFSYAANAEEITEPVKGSTPSNGTTDIIHVQQVDGLGRLVGVCEITSTSLGSGTPVTCSGITSTSSGLASPFGNSGYLTIYGYNPLDDLLTVNQSGLARSFTYDNLSRLLTSLNPEAGTDAYTYSTTGSACSPDPAVPCTRTDARSVVTSYEYDSLSRLVGKAYSAGTGFNGGTISDLSSCYQYDKPLSGVTDTNPKGQLTFEWQQAGSCPNSTASPITSIPSGAIAAHIPSNHDALGRVGTEQQCLTSSSCSSTVGVFQYTYNLAGAQVQSNDGIYASNVLWNQTAGNGNSTYTGNPLTPPSLTWESTYDEMGHLLQSHVQDQPAKSAFSSSDGPFSFAPTLVQPTNYDPFGHMTKASLDIGSANSATEVSLVRTSDNRGRIDSETDTGTNLPGSATVTIAGSDQVSAYSNGFVTLSGTEVSGDTGPIVVTVGGKAYSASYGSSSTTTTIASYLASIMTCSSGASDPVQGVAIGSTVFITSCAAGTSTSYSLSATSTESFTAETSASALTPVMTATPTGSGYEVSITGAANGTSGTIGLFLYGSTYSGPISIPWTSSSTPSSLLSAIVSTVGSCSNSSNSIGATLSGSDVFITACKPGALSSVSLSVLGCGCSQSQYDTFAFTVTNSAYLIDFDYATLQSGYSYASSGTFLVQIAATGSSGTTNANVSASWTSSTETTASMAQSMAAAFGSCSSGALMSASAVGDLVYLTGCQSGTTYTVSVEMSGCSCTQNVSQLFNIALANAEDIGIIPGPTYDAGTVALTVNGTQIASTSYTSSSTPASIASALASSGANSSVANLAAYGSSLTIVALNTGSGTDYSYSFSASSSSPSTFPSPSFDGSPASGSLGGGANTVTLYSWNITSFAPDGDILTQQDSVTGTWNFTYDPVDRLATSHNTATGAAPQYAGIRGCWIYDAYGNRLSESMSTTACSSSPLKQSSATYLSNTNRMATSSYAPGGVNIDASGNTLNDGRNEYWYDAEGQLCMVENLTIQSYIQYIYDASGARIGEGTPASAPGSNYATCAPPLGTGFTLSKRFLVDLGGEQVTELDGSNPLSGWQHSNVFAAGKLLATYDTKGIHYALNDSLGSKRVQVNALSEMDEYCTSLPFGNDLNNPYQTNCTPVQNSLSTADDATEHHFTGKERDSESGNDYFGARYYASTMGRFLSPDWSAKMMPVPYARLDNPQTLNLYAYLRNNPLAGVDADGHCPPDGPCDKVKVTVDQPTPSMQVKQQSGNGPVTGPGVQTTITITNDKQPVNGMTVNEHPMVTDNLADNPTKTPVPASELGTAKTGSDGTFKDNVIAPMKNGDVTPAQVSDLQSKSQEAGFSKTYDQTLTFTIPGGASCKATYSETLQNVNPDTGKFNPVNANGVNFTFTRTDPVVSPQ